MHGEETVQAKQTKEQLGRGQTILTSRELM